MSDKVTFTIKLHTMQTETFSSLLALGGHTDGWTLILEALALIGVYDRNVAGHATKMLIAYKPENTAAMEAIMPEISEHHQMIDTLTFEMSAAELGFMPDTDIATINTQLSRALILYEQVKLAEAYGMDIGIYDTTMQKIDVILQKSSFPVTHPAPRGMQ